MIEPKIVQAIKSQLFSVQSATVFTILDGASVPDLLANLAVFEPEYICLRRGELESDLAEVAPYLVRLERGAPFTDWGFPTDGENTGEYSGVHRLICGCSGTILASF